MPRPPSNTQRTWMTTKEVADVFEVTTETVRTWIASGKLAAQQVNTYNRVERSEVARFAQERFGFDSEAESPPV